ncbi:MAG: RNA methyltransferase [Oscillospiraceae bacterium]|nr:RNA methyltransferase [Oscillospiraceae bacterium]
MEREIITSRKNPLMTHLRKLASSRAYRGEHGEFLCDGVKMLDEAVRAGAPVVTVVCTERAELPLLDASVRVVCVPDDVMRSVSPMEAPQGVLFTCRLPNVRLPETLGGRGCLVLDGVQDPGNVGTIVRSADAFSCGAVILLEGCADPYSHKAARATMGAVFRRAVYSCTTQELFALLTRDGVPLYGAALRDDTVDVRAVSLRGAAVAVGSEGRGLRGEVLARCAKTVRIPMSEQCESLNAAMAANILLWEAFR